MSWEQQIFLAVHAFLTYKFVSAKPTFLGWLLDPFVYLHILKILKVLTTLHFYVYVRVCRCCLVRCVACLLTPSTIRNTLVDLKNWTKASVEESCFSLCYSTQWVRETMHTYTHTHTHTHRNNETHTGFRCKQEDCFFLFWFCTNWVSCSRWR